ncbi:LPXTG cell wall anchor domain-containing protein [Peptoniphilus sp. AGMB00490]|uniref:LPXTG cell wall anchor domain-containing protein n=1 Tax=Peptoniphilus faecalis TaxID=2731255 RepID=A0A848RHV4_9FIRM|nr:SpaA isopeptide-forming pilin-related protein [Peptoniphilus faecalis]NMW85023.1 LPXTG cell wall anchor domain-containing protein [Peptoniphilus faecalis]
MDRIFKKIICLTLALLMILEVFSPVAVAARGLFDEGEVQNSSTENQQKLPDDLFTGKSFTTDKTESNNKKDSRTEYEKSDGFLQPAKKKEDYEILVPAKKSPEKTSTDVKTPEKEDNPAEEKQEKQDEQARLEKEKEEALKIEAAKREAAARANEAELSEAEAEYKEAHEKRIELEKLLEEKLKEKSLRDQAKESEKSLNLEESNKSKDIIEEKQIEDEEEKGFLDKLKEGLGLTDLQRADKELKKALKNKDNGLEEIQALLNTFEDKYNLSREDQAKLMADNTEAFKEFIEEHGYENLDPKVFMIQKDEAENTGLEISDLYENYLREDRELTEEEMDAGLQKAEMPTVQNNFGFMRLRAAFGAEPSPLEDKKFTIRTRFDTSTRLGAIQVGQYFDIHLDEKLMVKDVSTLKPIVYKGQTIATPEYDEASNTIRYKIVREINEDISLPLNIDVDFNTGKIIPDESFTVINKISGLGVTPPKALLPVVVDKNGNTVNTIIEPGSDDVVKIIDDKNGNYQINLDAVGNPVIENREMIGINWTIRVNATQDLMDALGYKLNLTTVEGSGLGEITDVKINGQSVDLKDQLNGALGIVDSKHHDFQGKGQDLVYNFYTEVTNKQGNYVLDISTILTNKTDEQGRGKTGALRLVFDKGYTQDAIIESTPTRVGVNNRTTIEGKFNSNSQAIWTITDGVSSGDTNVTLPLETRSLGNNQNIAQGQSAVYGLNDQGQMVQIGSTQTITDFPQEGTNPGGNQAVGNIAVYKVITDLQSPETYQDYEVSGVKISKYRDLYVQQVWNLPEGLTMPSETFKAVGNDGDVLGEIKVSEGLDGEKERTITIPHVKYWNISSLGEAYLIDHRIKQEYDANPVTINGRTYRYYENVNYYKNYEKVHYIQNSAIEETEAKTASFKVVKVDSKDPNKKIKGVTFRLLGTGIDVTTNEEGEAVFKDIPSGSYQLKETKAADGYKIDQDLKAVNISDSGEISVSGNNADFSLGAGKTEYVEHSGYPDYMNAMYYGKVDENGNAEFYLFLKANAKKQGGSTDRDTRLNISIPGVEITDVTAYDVSPDKRDNVKDLMQKQTVDTVINSLGLSVINIVNSNMITGTPNKTDAYTGKIGYQIYFPQQRFANDWGFLVKVNANIGDNKSTTLSYEWLTDKDTGNQAQISKIVNLGNSGEEGLPSITIKNEEFTKSPISITKFDNSTEKQKLAGAEFVLKDRDGNIIANKVTGEYGVANFGEYASGVYTLEEVSAPKGYQKSKVYFEVTVDDKGQVTYSPKFKEGSGTPVLGEDYYKKTEEIQDDEKKAKAIKVKQNLTYQENTAGDIGRKPGVWEAYELESLQYHADITLDKSSPGTRFEIQFDPNLDFTQYFAEFPKIKIGGVYVADPYFNYDTNLLTYVFNDKSGGGTATISIDLRGIIPSKFYAKQDGTYKFTNIVAPGVTGVDGEQSKTNEIKADYGYYDTKFGAPAQASYFRDVYKDSDGNWYLKVISYYNALGDTGFGQRTVTWNWLSTNYQSNYAVYDWRANGTSPSFELEDVKIYRTDKNRKVIEEKALNENMPLSFGIRPEQDPYRYFLVYHMPINPNERISDRSNNFTLDYDPNQIQTSGVINQKTPLKIVMPNISSRGEGYVIEKTFKIPDLDAFNSSWRAFLMDSGNGTLRSAFASAANYNWSTGDQVGGEIPQYSKEIVGLINKKYTPGHFKITKLNEGNKQEKLTGAVFALTDEEGNTIYRSSDSDGIVSFTDLAPGRYTLVESTAPDKFRKSEKKWTVTVYDNGEVHILEVGILGADEEYHGTDINMEVTNKPMGTEFVVYKKDSKGTPLAGAEFKLTKPDDSTFSKIAESGQNGVVKFDNTLTDGTYILEESRAPEGYNKLDKKWVLVINNGEKKVYNYREPASPTELNSILEQGGVNWVNVRERTLDGWNLNDNRYTGWTGNSAEAHKLGTRIVGINKDKKYIIQRFVLNPESAQIGETTATIHREKPNYSNMDWYAGNETYQVFKLNKPVEGVISDIRLSEYGAEEIKDSVRRSTDNTNPREPQRLKLDFPATDKPIVVDIKVSYKDATGGVGLGMDWTENGTTYWKSDYYERVDTIKLAEPVVQEGDIKGAYVSSDSLDVTNEFKTFGFNLKKVKKVDENQVIEGATFKLTGPNPSQEEKIMTTGEDGIIYFDGLRPGTYKLSEEKAAPGYKKTDVTWTVTITKEGKAYYKVDNPDNINSEAFVENSIMFAASARNNIYSRYDPNSNLELENVIGLAVGPTLPGLLMKLGAAPEYTIGNTLTDQPFGKTNVTTNVTDLGNGKFEVQVDLANKNELFKNDGFFELKFNDNFDFVQGSTTTWLGAVQSDETRWHIGYNAAENKIDFKSGYPRIGRKQIAHIKFQVQAKDNLQSGTYDLVQPIKYRHDTDNSTQLQTIPSPQVTITKTVSSYNVGTSTVGNGTIAVDKINPVEAGNRVTITISPSQGNRLKQLLVNGNDVTANVSNNNYTFVMPESNVTVNAIFEQIPETTYKTIINVQENGTVTASPKENIKAGETVTLTLNPNPGYQFKSIDVNSTEGPVETTKVNDNTVTFAMPASDVGINVYFVPIPPTNYSINIDGSIEHGKVSASTTSAAEGAEVILTVTPDEGYKVESVTVDGVAITVDASGQYKFTMPASNVNVSATFAQAQDPGTTPPEGSVEIPTGGFALIKNEQTGLDLKVYKRDMYGNPLQGGEFTLKKYTDKNYETEDTNFTPINAESREDGLLVQKDAEGKDIAITLQPGYYLLEETQSPQGYKKIKAPWEIHVYEENGQLKADYKGPEDTPNTFIDSDKAKDVGKTGLTTTPSGIKYASRMTYINPESKTFIQRIYIDTRAYTGSNKINVQITPDIKREEFERPGEAPETITQGVKTAYRSTYKITGLSDNPSDSELDNILRYYDISRNDVSMVNTARWRPFDWGFDEDQLNIDKGVYYIDVEGFYDDNIIDLGEINMNIDFYDGARQFQQLVYGEPSFSYKVVDKGSYQSGMEALRQWIEKYRGKEEADNWANSKSYQDQKYVNALSKEAYLDGELYKAGRIYPALDDNKDSIVTSINIKPLYSSSKVNTIGLEGMDIRNDKETYNITFSKHGRDDPKESLTGEEVTNRRLEGAVFKLQESVGNTYVDVPGSSIASAFNGYFGFRELKPGRYRLIEVKAPEGYNPIEGPLLYFTIETINNNSGKIIDPETGETIDIKTIKVKFPTGSQNDTVYELSDLNMINSEGQTVPISSVDAKNINIEETKVINPNTNEQVLLKDLNIVVTDNEGKLKEYPVKQIKIVPDSSGYISLEYDEANGVYQYVPEKTTSEKDGKLVDFVTSATAKNMGKIVNEKPGKGSITVKKVDQNGKTISATDQLPGATFKLTNLSNDTVITKTVGEDGTLKFDGLNIGNYKLEEVKSPEGYVNTDQVWHFTVGGKDLDPYAGDISRTGVDLTSKIILDKSDMKVVNPENENNEPEQEGEIHPHVGESFEFDNTYKLAPNTKINPGDYFVLKLSKNININGILEDNVESLDIFADGVGTIAKADYDRENGTITYKFTDYANTYQLVEFSNKLSAFIDLYNLKESAEQRVGLGVGDDTSKYHDIRVVYDLNYAEYSDGYNSLNLASKIVSYRASNGEFVHYYYVNRKRQYTGPFKFNYSSEQDIENLKISYSALRNNYYVERDMPKSFGVDENSTNLMPFTTITSRTSLNANESVDLTFNGGLSNGDSGIIKVTGRVAGDDKSAYVGYGKLKLTYTNGEYIMVYRQDQVYTFENEASAKAELNIQAVNPENKIEFIKVDQDGKALKGASFTLYKKNNEGNFVGYGEVTKTTGEDGRFEFTKLKPGEYQLIETITPEGYVKQNDPLLEFSVDEKGKITRKGTNEEVGAVPITITNKKEQEVEFVKVDAKDKKALEGAEFEVWYKKDKNGEYSKELIKLYQDANNNKLVLNKDEKAPDGYDEVYKFTTGADGKVKFKLYDSGYYALKEIKAPEKYIKPKDYVKEFTVLDGNIEVDNNSFEIENHKGEYPLTGGMGTLIFTLSGLILMSAAAYVYKRKRSVSYDD